MANEVLGVYADHEKCRLRANVDVTAAIDITPANVAKMFWEMGSDEQALFFTELARLIEKENGCLATQLQGVVEDEGLTFKGRRVMDKIDEYAHHMQQEGKG